MSVIRNRMVVVISAMLLISCAADKKSKIVAICTDLDSDGHGAGCVGGSDCNDESADHWADCETCIDSDGDGYGYGCDLGNDCDDTQLQYHIDCGFCRDADSDGHSEFQAIWCLEGDDNCQADPNNWTTEGCASCIDGDGDSYHVGCDSYITIFGPDADDSDINNWTPVGATGCVDVDNDGHFFDCDGYFTIEGPDICDGDSDNWSSTGCTSCVDTDGDGYGANCDRGSDCTELEPSVHNGCGDCLDSDGDGHDDFDSVSCATGDDACPDDQNNWTKNGCNNCGDADYDSYYADCDFYITIAGPDADDADLNNWTPSGVNTCSDIDGDTFYAGCDAYFTISGPDECIGNGDNWTTAGCANCIDVDGDGYGAGCDRGADCDDDKPLFHNGCGECIDSDGDGHDDPEAYWCPSGDDACINDSNNWTAAGCSNCADADGDGAFLGCDYYITIYGPDADDGDINNWTPEGVIGCVDVDGDGWFQGCDDYIIISGPDADDTDINNWTHEGVIGCVDVDGDGWFQGCDDYIIISGPDSDDHDINNWTPQGATNCADGDGDGYYSGCDGYVTIPGPDANDADINNWTPEAVTNCVDADGDSYYIGCDSYLTNSGPDADDGDPNNWTNDGLAYCSDKDADGYYVNCDAFISINGPDFCDFDRNDWSLLGCENCTDLDGDGAYVDCDRYQFVNGPDLDETDPNNWTTEGLLNCQDSDGDGYYTGCDAYLTIQGPDGDDFDPNIILNLDINNNGIARYPYGPDCDDDGDGHVQLDCGGNDFDDTDWSQYLSLGSGTFSNQESHDHNKGCYGLARDIDKDGYLDLVRRDSSQNAVYILYNDGLGYFYDKTIIPVENISNPLIVENIPSLLISVDFDNDGELDFATLDSDNSSIVILLNDGFGYFDNQIIVPLAFSPTGMKTADFNGDGSFDLAVVGDWYEQSVHILLNDGLGNLSEQSNLVIDFYALEYEALDFDLDGDIDLVLADHAGDRVKLLLNNGGGTFSSGPDMMVGEYPKSIIASDIDDDADYDIVVGNYMSDDISVLINKGDGTFFPEVRYRGSNSPTNLLSSDLDGDGFIELITASWHEYFFAFEQKGEGVFYRDAIGYFDKTKGYCITLIDIDGNRTIDMLNGEEWNVLKGELRDADQDGVTVDLDCNDEDHKHQADCGVCIDKDGDGRGAACDLGADCDDTDIDNWQGCALCNDADGDGFWFGCDQYRNHSGPDIDDADSAGGHVLDLDGDGIRRMPFGPDCDDDGDGILQYECGGSDYLDSTTDLNAHFGGGEFVDGGRIAVGSGPTSVAVEDIDGDGINDIIAAIGDEGELEIIWGTVDGSFNDRKLIRVGYGPTSIQIRDFNGDGLLDLACANPGGMAIAVVFNLGDRVFRTEHILRTGNSPAAVEAGDFDGDGDFDLAATDGWDDTLTILLNSGTGEFTVSEVLSADGSYAMQAADLNEDGVTDLAVANSSTADRSVFLNDGYGSFGLEISPLASLPGGQDISAVDADNDGDMDLLIAYGYYSYSLTHGKVFFLKNDGSGNFTEEETIETGRVSRALTLADLDGDGDNDLATANNYDDNVTIYLNDGSGNYNYLLSYAAGDAPQSIYAADINGDQALDLLVTNDNTNDITILLGTLRDADRDGFDVTSDCDDADPLHHDDCGYCIDADGDGRGDYCNDGYDCDDADDRNWDSCGACVDSDGDGYYTGCDSYLTAPGPDADDSDPTVCSASDYDCDGLRRYPIGSDCDDDGDGHLQLACGGDDIDDRDKTIYKTNGPVGFKQPVLLGSGDGPVSIAAGDIDGDGDIDLASTNYDSKDFSVFFNNADGTFDSEMRLASDKAPGDPNSSSITLADLNGDDYLDIAASGRSISIFYYRGYRLFSSELSTNCSKSWFSGECPLQVNSSDFNNDDIVDLAFATTLPSVGVYLNHNIEGIPGRTLYAAGAPFHYYYWSYYDYQMDGFAYPIATFSADLNSDGYIDLATANYEYYNGWDGTYRRVSVLLNDGDGTFATAIHFDTKKNPVDITGADFDGDGDIDLAVANEQLNNSVEALINDGAGNFTRKTVPVGTIQVSDIVAADFDGDGDVDLICASENFSTITLFANDGNANFSLAESYSLPGAPWDILVADFNGDRKIDIAAPLKENDKIAILFGKDLDRDGDGIPATTDCDDSNPIYWTNCTSCVDADGDGRGDYCDFGPDCDDANPNAWASCSTCVDADGDGYYGFCDEYNSPVTGPDIDDSDPAACYIYDIDCDGGMRYPHGADCDDDGDGVESYACGGSDVDDSDPTISQSIGGGEFTIGQVLTPGGESSIYYGTIFTGDLDKDGDKDIALTNYQGHSILILKNEGDGYFSDGGYILFPYGGGALAGADFNGDGNIDLASDYSIGKVAIAPGNGDGTFGDPIISDVGFDISIINAGDIDGDHDFDLVIFGASGSDGYLETFINDGHGVFTPGGAPISLDKYGGFILSDLNSDNYPDIIRRYTEVHFAGNNWVYTIYIKIFINDGTGAYHVQRVMTQSGVGNYIGVGDIDGDGNIDILAPESSNDRLSIYSNLGNASFFWSGAYNTGDSPNKAWSADFTGNGLNDVVTLNNYSISMFNNSAAGLKIGNEIAFESSLIAGAIDDFNADGVWDMVIADRDGKLHILLGEFSDLDGDGYISDIDCDDFSPLHWDDCGNCIDNDFDNYGPGCNSGADCDDADPNNWVSCALCADGDGDGSFINCDAYTTIFGPDLDDVDPQITDPLDIDRDGNRRFPYGGDYDDDGDGHKQYIAGGDDFDDSDPGVWKSLGSGEFALPVTYDVGIRPVSIIVEDLNNDGLVDIATANEGSGDVSILLNEGGGSFQRAINIEHPSYISNISAADIDADGDLDIIVNESPGIYINDGSGSFTLSDNPGHGTIPGDFDNDGDLDIASNTGVIFNNGNYSFSAPIFFSNLISLLGNSGRAKTAADFDGDGDLDIVISSHNYYSFEPLGGVLFNRGDGVFDQCDGFGSGNGNTDRTNSITLLDAFGRGMPDIVLTRSDLWGKGFAFYKNNGSGLFEDHPNLEYEEGYDNDYYGDTIIAGAAAADFNADGNMDIAIAETLLDSIRIYEGNGAGVFAPAITIDQVGDGPIAIALEDLNGDGAIDIVIANQVDNSIRIVFGLVKDSDGDGILANVDCDDASPDHWSDCGLCQDPDMDGRGTDCDLGAVDCDGNDPNNWESCSTCIDSDGDGFYIGCDDYVSIFGPDQDDSDSSVCFLHDDDCDAVPGFPNGSDCDDDGDGYTSLQCGGTDVDDSDPALQLNAAGGYFEEGVPYPVGSDPAGLVVDDFNNDGAPDIATASNWNDTMSILLNLGDGTFSAGVDYPVGDGPYDITSADIDGDGFQDLVVANYDGGSISILFNDGFGQFSDKLDYLPAFAPTSLAAFDINGDLMVDIVAASQYSNSITVLFNNGNRSFQPEIHHQAADSPSSVFPFDSDSDGDFDLGVALYESRQVGVLINEMGDFPPMAKYAVTKHPTDVKAADINGDGFPDLVAADVKIEGLLYEGPTAYARDITITTEAGVAYSLPPWNAYIKEGIEYLLLADFNGDGMIDIAGTTSTNDTLSIFLNQGNGEFTTRVFHQIGDQPRFLAAEDLNGDGALDLVTTSRSQNNVIVLLGKIRDLDNDGVSFLDDCDETNALHWADCGACVDSDADGRGILCDLGTDCDDGDPDSWASCGSCVDNDGDGIYSGCDQYLSIAGPDADDTDNLTCFLEDIDCDGVRQFPYGADCDDDGDGYLNYLCGGIDSDDTDRLTYLNTSSGIYGDAYFHNIAWGPTHLSLGDLNADGMIDVIATLRNSNQIKVLMGDGAGNFTANGIYGVGLYPSASVVADYDSDGDLDIAVSSSSSYHISLLYNDGRGHFTSGLFFPVSARPEAMTAADLDSDGDQDLLTANSDGQNVSVLINRGDGTFENKIDVGVGGEARAIVAADLVGKGVPAIAVANYDTGEIRVRKGYGDGTFTWGKYYPVGLEPTAIKAADINSDGSLDLVVANSGDNTISVLNNTGNGNYDVAINYDVGMEPIDVAAGDLDGDGAIDLTVVNRFGNTATLLYNNGDGTFQIQATPQTGEAPISVLLADVNNDIMLDILVLNQYSNDLSVYWGGCLDTDDDAHCSDIDCNDDAPLHWKDCGLCVDLDGDGRGVGCDMGVSDCDDTDINNWDSCSSCIDSDGDGVFIGCDSYTTISGPDIDDTDSRKHLRLDLDGDGIRRYPFGSDCDDDNDGYSPYSCGGIDFNDSDPDVYMNGGQFAFSTPVVYPSGGYISYIITGDIDGDLDKDIVGYGYQSYIPNVFKLYIFKNDGLGNFAAPDHYISEGQIRELKLADFDSDGDLDIAIVDRVGNSINVLFNHGDGTFSSQHKQVLSSDLLSMDIADFDSDGDIDLAVVENYYTGSFQYEGYISILFNNGDGNFTPSIHYDAGQSHASVCTADFDLDADIDLATVGNNGASPFGGEIHILLNNGSGIFSLGSQITNYHNIYKVISAELDNLNSGPDLIIPQESYSYVGVRKNQGAANFADSWGYSVGNSPQQAIVADINSDGLLDILTANYDSTNPISVLINTGINSRSSEFLDAQTIDIGNVAYSLAADDFNGDGKLDLAAAGGHHRHLKIILGQ